MVLTMLEPSTNHSPDIVDLFLKTPLWNNNKSRYQSEGKYSQCTRKYIISLVYVGT